MAEPRRIRIVSDGTPMGTHVFDGEHELDPGSITDVAWSITARPPHLATATVTFRHVQVDVVGELVRREVPCPFCEEQAEQGDPHRDGGSSDAAAEAEQTHTGATE